MNMQYAPNKSISNPRVTLYRPRTIPTRTFEYFLHICDDLKSKMSLLETALKNVKDEKIEAPKYSFHPLGFCRVELPFCRTDKNFRLYANVWPITDEQHDGGDVHDHCYDFVSCVVVGGLNHIIYRETDSKTYGEFVQHDYAGGSNIDVGDTRDNGQQRLQAKEELYISKGQKYGFDADTLHVAYADPHPTVTFQLQGPYIKDQARVFRSVDSINRLADQSRSKNVSIVKTIEWALGEIV